MNNHRLTFLVIVLICLSGTSPGWAVEHPVDIHQYAKMSYAGFGPVEQTYGYLNIVSNENGKGMINVMFSNGRQTDWVKFNARVKFLDASGKVIEEANLHRWVGSAGVEGAAERKVTKPLKVSKFDSVEVEFYLTETHKLVATMPRYKTLLNSDERLACRIILY